MSRIICRDVCGGRDRIVIPGLYNDGQYSQALTPRCGGLLSGSDIHSFRSPGRCSYHGPKQCCDDIYRVSGSSSWIEGGSCARNHSICGCRKDPELQRDRIYDDTITCRIEHMVPGPHWTCWSYHIPWSRT